MSPKRPPSPLPARRPAEQDHLDHHRDRPYISDTKFIPPPPLFLGPTANAHAHAFNPAIPASSIMYPYPHAPERVHNDNFRPPPDLRVDPSDQSKRGQAVPIAALLAESHPAHHRQDRSDSLVSPIVGHPHHQQIQTYPAYTSPTHDLHRAQFISPTSPSTHPPTYWQQQQPAEHYIPAAYQQAHWHQGAPSARPHRLSIHSPSSRSSSSRHAPSDEPASARSETNPSEPPGPPPAELEYTLHMRQQPRAARACGNGDRDRRVIDPPPIIQVRARDPATGNSHIDSDSYTTLHCMLINASTGRDESFVTVARPEGAGGGASTTQQLVGCAVASPWVGHDEHKERGSFFVFSDLSVRQVGRYKLLFRLLKVNPLDMSNKGKNYIRATIESDIFEVFQAKEFPGMRASSALLKALRAQGLNVGVKKGSVSAAGSKGKTGGAAGSREEQHGGQRGRGDDEDDEAEEEEAEDEDEDDRAKHNIRPAQSRNDAELRKTKSVKRLRTS